MTICNSILTPIVVVVRTVIQVVREVVRTVCEWVSSTVRTVRTVVERVCSWLPWPINELCNLVTRVIEVIETVWNWVCREVVERIIDWVERIVEYVFYVLRWVCWVINWFGRGPSLLLCTLGIRPRRFLTICIKVIAEGDGTPAVEWDKVDNDVRQAQAILENCNMEVVVADRERVTKPEFMDGTTCDFTGMFTDFFTWFSANECSQCSAVTVYYVRSIPGASGCAYPGTNWVTVAASGDGRTMVQEVGHLADLWGHSDDPNNVMTDQPGGTSDQITSFQCCMLRTSRFSRPTPCLPIEPIGRAPLPLETAGSAEPGRHSLAFQRARLKEIHSLPASGVRVAQFAAALGLVGWLGRAFLRRIRHR